MKKLTYENIAHAKELNVYLEQGNRVLDALGYTDHSQKHTAKVAVTAGKILMNIELDESICSMIDYFEIFSQRMLMCKRAAEVLGLRFKLVANGNKIA